MLPHLPYAAVLAPMDTRLEALARVRRAAYVDARLWAAADAAERYRLGVLAIARTRPGDVLSHHAALAVHGLPLWGFTAERIETECWPHLQVGQRSASGCVAGRGLGGL